MPDTLILPPSSQRPLLVSGITTSPNLCVHVVSETVLVSGECGGPPGGGGGAGGCGRDGCKGGINGSGGGGGGGGELNLGGFVPNQIIGTKAASRMKIRDLHGCFLSTLWGIFRHD